MVRGGLELAISYQPVSGQQVSGQLSAGQLSATLTAAPGVPGNELTGLKMKCALEVHFAAGGWWGGVRSVVRFSLPSGNIAST
jgi:hypothetical protein